MLKVAFDYRTVVDNITGNKTLKLRPYELHDGDWEVVKDLLRVLKVSVNLRDAVSCHSSSSLDVQGCDTFFLSR